MLPNNITGQLFGNLTALKIHHKIKRYKNNKLIATRIFWLCKCKCGKQSVVQSSSLISGVTKSCGCLSRKLASERARARNHKHGMFGTRFYAIWRGILARCKNVKHMHYDRYGGRGINVEWKTFMEFKDDMYGSYLKQCRLKGEKVTSVERINNNGNYCKENCRWATPMEQSRNRIGIRMVTFNGVTKCLTDWGKELGINYGSVSNRLKRWPISEALSIGKGQRRRGTEA